MPAPWPSASRTPPDMVANSLSFFDSAITENCFHKKWRGGMLLFIAASKLAFATENIDTEMDFKSACAWSREHHFSFILKNPILTA